MLMTETVKILTPKSARAERRQASILLEEWFLRTGPMLCVFFSKLRDRSA
jgi:hypothetical protein